MKNHTTENNAEQEEPLWIRICLRLICGIVTATILGAIGWWRSERSGLLSGAFFGFLCGVGFGENALGSIFSGYIMSGGKR